MSATGTAPFDRVANEYDRSFTHTLLGMSLRGALWERLGTHFQPGMRVLELGCGTGEDALWLAQQGVRVAATDVSPRMLAVAARKAAAAGVADQVEFQVIDLDRDRPGLTDFDGAFSSFGALNCCVSDLQGLAGWLAETVRPGGHLVLVAMGPWCAWEILWHLAHRDPATALRRLRPGGAAARVGGEPLRVRYPSAPNLERAFSPWFRTLGARGLGVFLPPSYAGAWVARRPSIFGALRTAEKRLAGAWPFRLLGDHYVIELERLPHAPTAASDSVPGIHHEGTKGTKLLEFSSWTSCLRGESPRLARQLWRRVLRWRYRLFQAHRHNRLAIEQVAGMQLLVLPGVFNPKLFRSGESLARWAAAVVKPGERVLDLGTGSGVGAVFAARAGAHVVAVDVNPAAVRCARVNALLHDLDDRIQARCGDLFAPVSGERFELVLFNPPYYPGAPRDPLDGAFRSEDVVERFAAGLDRVLTPGGRAVMVLSSDADVPRTLARLQGRGFRAELLEQKDLVNETISVWRLTRAEEGEPNV